MHNCRTLRYIIDVMMANVNGVNCGSLSLEEMKMIFRRVGTVFKFFIDLCILPNVRIGDSNKWAIK